MKKLITLIYIAVTALILVGCFPTQTLTREQYVLNVSMLKKVKPIVTHKILKVDDTTIVSQFSNTSFVYRTSNINYLSDYYHAFFIPPSDLIQQLISQYLSRTGLFNQVVFQDSYLKPQYILRSKILALYADYRHRNNPKGRISIEFTLTQPKEQGKEKVVMNKTYSEAIPLHSKDSASLVNAWNAGLSRILRRLKIDLHKTLLSRPTL